MDIVLAVLQFLAVAGAIYRVYLIWSRRNAFLEGHPPMGYVAVNGPEGWRWSEPPPGLPLRREELGPVSRLHLPPTPMTANIVGSVVGYLLLLVGAAMCIYFFFLVPNVQNSCGGFFLGLLALAAGRGLLELDSRLVAIDLERDRVVFVVRYGIHLFHHRVIPRKPWARVTGKVQGFLAAEDRTLPPDFVLTLHRRFLPKRLLVSCDPSAGSWIVGGIEHWKQFGAGLQPS